MSKRKDNTLAYILIGAAAVLFLSKRNAPAANYAPQFAAAPPPPPRSNAQAFAAWVAAMMSIYGNVSQLWQPGGPFYNMPANEIYDAANSNPIPDYNNPYLSTTGGWA